MDTVKLPVPCSEENVFSAPNLICVATNTQRFMYTNEMPARRHTHIQNMCANREWKVGLLWRTFLYAHGKHTDIKISCLNRESDTALSKWVELDLSRREVAPYHWAARTQFIRNNYILRSHREKVFKHRQHNKNLRNHIQISNNNHMRSVCVCVCYCWCYQPIVIWLSLLTIRIWLSSSGDYMPFIRKCHTRRWHRSRCSNIDSMVRT